MSEITEIKTLNGYPLADTKAREDIATLTEDVTALSEEIEGVKAEFIQSDYVLVGNTPHTLDESGDVRLVASETTEYSITTPTVADFRLASPTLTNCTLVENNGEYEMRLTQAITGFFQAYALWIVEGLTPGVKYRLYLECTDDQYQPSTMTIYAKGDTNTIFGTYFAGQWQNLTVSYIEFTPTVADIEVRIFVVNQGRDTGDSSVWLENAVNRFKNIYINKASTGYKYRTEVVNVNAIFNGSTVIMDVPKMAMIEATPACTVYYRVGEEEQEIDIPVSRHDGKVCVCFGDSITGNPTAPNDYPSILAAETGMTVINGGFGGCRMGWHSLPAYDAFSMYRLADAVATGDWSAQQTNVANIESINREEHLASLMAVDWSKVDFITIAYGTNDIAGGNDIDNIENTTDTKTVLGALRYSIERILTAYPHIKLLILTPIYRYWNDDDLDSDEKQFSGKSFVSFGDGMIEVAKAYKIPAVDMYRTLGFNAITRSYYFPATDGTHPNVYGQRAIGGKVAARLLAEY